jgi:hypothetical protein
VTPADWLAFFFAFNVYRSPEFFIGILIATAVCWFRWRRRR